MQCRLRGSVTTLPSNCCVLVCLFLSFFFLGWWWGTSMSYVNDKVQRTCEMKSDGFLFIYILSVAQSFWNFQIMARLCAKFQNVWVTEIMPTAPLIRSIHHQYMQAKHNSDVIMGAMASQITSPTIVYLNVYSRRRSNKIWKLRVAGLYGGNSPVIGEFPTQRTSNAEMFPFDDVIMGMYVHAMTMLTLESSNEIDYDLNQYPRPVI